MQTPIPGGRQKALPRSIAGCVVTMQHGRDKVGDVRRVASSLAAAVQVGQPKKAPVPRATRYSIHITSSWR